MATWFVALLTWIGTCLGTALSAPWWMGLAAIIEAGATVLAWRAVKESRNQIAESRAQLSEMQHALSYPMLTVQLDDSQRLARTALYLRSVGPGTAFDIILLHQGDGIVRPNRIGVLPPKEGASLSITVSESQTSLPVCLKFRDGLGRWYQYQATFNWASDGQDGWQLLDHSEIQNRLNS